VSAWRARSAIAPALDEGANNLRRSEVAIPGGRLFAAALGGSFHVEASLCIVR
jgi:hypothetical protein